jgi:hypothetical protein
VPSTSSTSLSQPFGCPEQGLGLDVGPVVVGGRPAYVLAVLPQVTGQPAERVRPAPRDGGHRPVTGDRARHGLVGQVGQVVDAGREPIEPPGHVQHGVADRGHRGHVDAGDLAHGTSHRYLP